MILRHEIIGEGDPLVFLHGLGADRRQTTRALSSLAENSGIQLIAVDFRGHGDSVDDSDGVCLTFDSFADDIIALLDYLKIDTVFLGGLSMGAGVSLNLALRYPNRVNNLILLRPSWLNEGCPSHLDIVAKIGKWIEQYGIDKAKDKLQDYPAFVELKKREPTVAASIIPLFTRPQAVSGAPVLYKMFESRPLVALEHLEEVEQRTLVIDTTRDDLHPQFVARKIFENLSNQRNVYITLPPRYIENEAYNIRLVEEIHKFLLS